MDISVVVPIYNTEYYIERCLRSLFTQTKTDGVEFILVNDCTPDDSMAIAREIIAEYPDLSIRILENSVNRLVAATRQTGLDAAVGDYTIQIDSDDWCEPTMLEDMYNKAIENGADIVSCDFMMSSGKILENRLRDDKIDRVSDVLLSITSPSLCIRLIRRDLYVKNGVKVNNGFNCFEDLVAIVQLYYYTDNILHISYPYYHYISNHSSMTSALYKYSNDCVKAYDYLTYFFEKLGDNRFCSILITIKIRMKYYFVSTLTSTNDVYGYMTIFPDIRREDVFSSKNLSFPAKCIMYSTSKGWIWFVILINKSRVLYHRLVSAIS